MTDLITSGIEYKYWMLTAMLMRLIFIDMRLLFSTSWSHSSKDIYNSSRGMEIIFTQSSSQAFTSYLKEAQEDWKEKIALHGNNMWCSLAYTIIITKIQDALLD